MTNFTREAVEAALDSASAFGWMPEGDKRDRRFVIFKDFIPLGRATRTMGAGVSGVTAFSFDGRQVGPAVGDLAAAGQALETELRRRWAAGCADEVTAQINTAATEIGA